MAERSEIDDVQTRTDVVSLIEQYVTLKRAGRNYKGLCPFHHEKTPSFHVNPDLGRWQCFGQCSEGGDAIRFLEKIENLSFFEALERLALRAGVTLTNKREQSPSSSGSAGSGVGEREQIYRINGLALGYFREHLRQSSVAREYFQARGVAHGTQEKFFLGFAPDLWEGLTDHLVKQGISLALAEKAGLVTKTDRGNYIDKLRGRVVFPILDVQERPIAFGGRILEEASPGQPKYWNSPETPVFSKSRTLYGLWLARKAIAAQGKAIVVEGYTDVIAAHQAGVENVVATLGTSLTEEHVKTLARLAPQVLLAFDADSAGLKAAFRAAEIFEAQEVDVRALDLPEGDDPDSLLRKGQYDVFARAIDDALPIIEYRLKRLIKRSPLKSERDHVDLFRKALPILASVPSMVEREQYIKMLAISHPRYNAGSAYAEEQIRQDVAAFQATRGRNNPYAASEHTGNSYPSRMSAMPPIQDALATAERHLLRALVSSEDGLAEYVHSNMQPDEFITPTARALALALYDSYQKTGTFAAGDLLNDLSDQDQVNALAGLLMSEDEPLNPHVLDGHLLHLKMRAKEQACARLKEQIDNGTADAAIFKQYQMLNQELKGTRTPRTA